MAWLHAIRGFGRRLVEDCVVISVCGLMAFGTNVQAKSKYTWESRAQKAEEEEEEEEEKSGLQEKESQEKANEAHRSAETQSPKTGSKKTCTASTKEPVPSNPLQTIPNSDPQKKAFQTAGPACARPASSKHRSPCAQEVRSAASHSQDAFSDSETEW